MLVRDIMHTNPITVSPETTLEDAYRHMQENRFRHLPVLDGSLLVGVVTDRDLRLATSELSTKPFHPSARVADVMAANPRTASPLDPVEDAARLMRELKIGCLPVMDGDRLVGIVTGIDLLDALLRLTGVDKPSSRIEVAVEDKPGELSRLAAFFGQRYINIHSLLTYPDRPDRLRAVLRVGAIESRPLAEDLAKEGFDVIWPPPKPWRS